MYRAAGLLREGERGLAEIALAVGYESAGAFRRVFQRLYTKTPGEFRRALREGSAIPLFYFLTKSEKAAA